MEKPYIGVTGPVTVDEVRQVGQTFKEVGFTRESAHIPMIGILVSYKTLNGQSTENRRYPRYKEVPAMIHEAGKFGIPVIHYNSREQETLGDQLSTMLADCRDLKGFQLNMVWPDQSKVRALKRTSPNIQVVIQLSHSAMQDLTPQAIARRVKEYRDIATYTLIDPSGGRGKEFDLQKSVEIYNQLREQVPQTVVGFAGGFKGDNVAQTTAKLVDLIKTQDFCIDAEGGLRDKVTEKYGDDLLNLDKVRHYLSEAAKVLD